MSVHTGATLFQWATDTALSGTSSVEALTARGWRVVAAHRWYSGTWLLAREEDEDELERPEPLDDELTGWPDPDAGDGHHEDTAVTEGKAP